MKRSHGIAAVAAFSILSALPFATTASAAVELPKFLINVQRARVTDDVIEKIHAGQTKEDITALIGAPRQTTEFPRSHTISWDYDYRDTGGYEAVFSVIFDEAGVVRSKFTARYGS